MMNLQTASAAAPAQQAASQDASPFVRAKKLVSSINQVVSLRNDQFSKVNEICIDYFKQLDELNNAKPADLNVKVTALKNTRNEKIKASLAADQLKAWAGFKD